jgi:ribose 5-phosphate isomerase B
MKIAMASDHAGFGLKQELKALLTAAGHDVVDFGTENESACDLVDFAYPAALAVGRQEVDRAILVDGVGYGSAMVANRILGVDAAVCQDPFCAGLARSHSDSNVLCLGAKVIGSGIAAAVVEVWMATEYLADQEKYTRRVEKGRAVAQRHLRPLDDV